MTPYYRYLLMTLAIIPMLANASTDWTPFLKPMQTNCQWPSQDLEQLTIPASYQSSVASKKIQGIPDKRTITLKLKNAMAFGAPLAKIKFEASTAGGALTLYFTNTDFMKHIREFHYQGEGVNLTASVPKKVTTATGTVYTANAIGYDIDEGTSGTTLTFNPQQKTIQCSSGGD